MEGPVKTNSMELTNEIKAELQEYTGIIYDWYFMEIERVCTEMKVNDSDSLKNAIKFLISDSENEPAFRSFLLFIEQKYCNQ